MAVEKTGALVLAAGKGTRMKSETPKVMLPVLEEPLLWYVLKNLASSTLSESCVVVGHGREVVENYLAENWPAVKICVQNRQNGTGHAVICARDWLGKLDHVLVIPGDVPHLTSDSADRLIEEHIFSKAACTFYGFRPEDPTGYGRVITEEGLVRIVEERDATKKERKCPVANSGIYVFRTRELLESLEEISSDNAQGEYYLTDVVGIMSRKGQGVKVVLLDAAAEASGVNDPLQLASASMVIRDRVLEKHMRQGVRFVDPTTVYVGPKVKIAEDVDIGPFVQIYGNSEIGRASKIGSHSVLKNVLCGERTDLRGYVDISDSRLSDGAAVGPFAHIRNGSEVLEGAYIGKFVEIKKSRIGAEAKVPHLSYIGDAEIGERTNIGAGTITCNFDGVNKHHTTIGSDCFVGSDTMLVAPVTLGDSSYTGAGSVITKDVPEGSLAVARSRQTNIEGWAHRKKKQGGQS